VMLLGDSEGVKYRPFVVFKTEPSKVPKMFEENMKRRNGFGRRIWDDIEPACHTKLQSRNIRKPSRYVAVVS